MTGQPDLLWPLALMALGAVAAGLFAVPPIGRRIGNVPQGWLLALAPGFAFVAVLSRASGLAPGAAEAWSVTWLPSVGLRLGLHVDSLSLLFSLLVTGIGALVTVYTGYYFGAKAPAWRFQALMLAFGTAMLGLVMAGDVITLFVFWEATSVLSFLLIGYRTEDPASRSAALKSLLITGGGGLALLLGVLLLADAAGSTDIAAINAAGDALRAHGAYGAILLLVFTGAMTKSAQMPAHIWLPGAMAAPTPASAYLHSATMVKAGIYLMARLNPALGGTTTWFWLLTAFGTVTMVAAAVIGLRQRDLKALLAYATVSQLGALMLLIGQETSLAFKALVVGVLAHALYKSALFLVVGIVDHEAGSRLLDRLGGLRRAMPATAAVTAMGALSMAGFPPMFGFLAKETLLATAVDPGIPPLMSVVLPAAAVAAGALMLTMALVMVWETFFGRPGEAAKAAHEPPAGMLMAPLVPAVLSLAVGLLPEPAGLARLLAGAAQDAYGGPVKVSLALWTGLSVPLALSAAAIAAGTAAFVRRDAARAALARVAPAPTTDALYERALAALDAVGHAAAGLQAGRLGTYLSVILAGTFLAGLGALALSFAPDALGAGLVPALGAAGNYPLLRLFTLGVAVTGAAASVLLGRDLAAILALNASGLAVAMLMVLEPAPDVALVQIVVDLLATVILVLALSRLPRAERRVASAGAWLSRGRHALRDLALATVAGTTVAWATFVALATRPRPSAVSGMYALSAKPMTGARDVVGAIVVDFRALDTLIEISVFAMAGLGAYSLLRRYAHVPEPPSVRPAPALLEAIAPNSEGIGGKVTSSFVHALAYASLPTSIVLAAVQTLYGHDRPGDGFTAGVLVSLALGLWYVVFGYESTRRRLPWLQPMRLAGAGLATGIGGGLIGLWLGGSFLAPVDVGRLAGLPAPPGVHWSTSLVFEVAIALTVVGAATSMLDALGRAGWLGHGPEGAP